MSDKNNPGNIIDRLYNCVNFGIDWGIDQVKSKCPHRKKKPVCPAKPKEDESTSNVGLNESVVCPPPPSPQPREVRPLRQEYCYIKMQDPCSPCCCETKPKPPPCPPKCYPEPPREPICGCDLCKKGYADGKCCDQSKIFRGTSAGPRVFEKA